MTSFSRAGTRPGPGRCLVSVPADGATPDALLRMSRRLRRSLRTGKLPAKNGRAVAKFFLSKGEGVEQRVEHQLRPLDHLPAQNRRPLLFGPSHRKRTHREATRLPQLTIHENLRLDTVWIEI